MIGIYAVRNKVNNKMYIGQSIDIEHRWRSHKADLRTEHGHNPHIKKDYEQYGLDVFELVILEQCPAEKLHEREAFWIKFLQTTKRARGYNVSIGGKAGTGIPMPQHLREAHRQRMLTNNPSSGGLSPEHRAKLSQVRKGIPKSEEWKAKMRNREFTEEHRKKLSETAHTRKIPESETKEIIHRWQAGESFSSIARSYNVSVSTIQRKIRKSLGVAIST